MKSELLYVFLTKCNSYNSVSLIFKNIFYNHFYFGVGFFVLFCHFVFVVLGGFCVFVFGFGLGFFLY